MAIVIALHDRLARERGDMRCLNSVLDNGLRIPIRPLHGLRRVRFMPTVRDNTGVSPAQRIIAILHMLQGAARPPASTLEKLPVPALQRQTQQELDTRLYPPADL